MWKEKGNLYKIWHVRCLCLGLNIFTSALLNIYIRCPIFFYHFLRHLRRQLVVEGTDFRPTIIEIGYLIRQNFRHQLEISVLSVENNFKFFFYISADKIKPDFQHFCPPQFCPIRYNFSLLRNLAPPAVTVGILLL